MPIRVEWTIEGCGSGAETVEGVDEAVQAVLTACRQVTGHLTAQQQSEALLGLVPRVRFGMVTEGRRAVGKGESWDFVAAAIFVRMTPA